MEARNETLARRQRTRQLIELGGLVLKSGLIERTGDDPAVILGALLELTAAIGKAEARLDERHTRWRARAQAMMRQDPAT